MPKKNDILITAVGTLGNVWKINNNDAFYFKDGNLIWLKEIKCNSDFLEKIIQLNTRELIKTSIGSTQKALTMVELRKIQFFFPNLQEQQKIANFLTAVDSKIKQLQKKKSLLQDYKKGIMQQIFSQELRFKDKDGKSYPNWEENTLGEIGNTFNGLTGKTKEHFGEGKPYIQYKQIFDSSKINISNCGYVNITENEKQSKAQFGDVFFTISSETPNEIGTASVLSDKVKEMYLNSFCFGFRVSLDILYPLFSQYLFRNENFRRKIIPLAQGSTRYNISKVSFLKLSVVIPTIKEQTQIANFLSAIDTKIDLVNTQIANTQVFKKGLLQQMFV